MWRIIFLPTFRWNMLPPSARWTNLVQMDKKLELLFFNAVISQTTISATNAVTD